MKEQSIQNIVRAELSEFGFLVFRTNAGKVYVCKPTILIRSQMLLDNYTFFEGLPKGFSDLIAISPPKFNLPMIYFIEIKKSGGKISQEQMNFRNRVKMFGCGYLLIDNIVRISQFKQDILNGMV